jgi:hypothetical protein
MLFWWTNLPIIGSGAGYTFGSGVVHKFLDQNKMSHILRAHQLCMEGYASLFDSHLSTVWSAPNYCYRCGNSASILEISPGGAMHFNVFEAAPENERDGPSQQAAQNAGAKVRTLDCTKEDITESSIYLATGVFPIDLHQDFTKIMILPTTVCSSNLDFYQTQTTWKYTWTVVNSIANSTTRYSV